MKQQHEIKSSHWPSAVKVLDEDQGIVEHIITVFGVLDHGGDISHPGSFVKTIAERGMQVLVLDQHRTDTVNSVLGKPLSLREISRAELPERIQREYPEATGGVKAETQFLMDTEEGRGAFARIKSGALREWSYGYDALDYDFSEIEVDGRKATVRNLRTIRLYEYSPVLWGMAESATLGAKSAADPVVEEAKEEPTSPAAPAVEPAAVTLEAVNALTSAFEQVRAMLLEVAAPTQAEIPPATDGGDKHEAADAASTEQAGPEAESPDGGNGEPPTSDAQVDDLLLLAQIGAAQAALLQIETEINDEDV